MNNHKHYLEAELSDLFAAEKDTWNFVQSASLDGVWYWDLEKPDNLWISPEYWDCLGIDPATRKHTPEEFIDVVFPEDLPNIMKNLEQHYADKSVVYEQIVRFKHVDGSTVWVRCCGKATRDKNGNAIRMLGAHNNITSLKNAEIETQNLMRNRERFFARMSHEIRTPLHGILGLTESLQQSKLQPSVMSKIQTVLDCGKQLQHLLDDLLTISKIEEGKFFVSIEDVSLASILRFVDELYRPQAQAKSLYLKIPDLALNSVIVRSDQVRLTQILSNIVSNAIKFTHKGGVTVTFEQTNDNLDIVITDTGVGIDNVDSAMRAYYQEAQSEHDMRIQGTGLGLEIVEKLCANLSHPLKIESELDEGTKVRISMIKSSGPVPNESAQPVKRSADDVRVKPTSVLIVDDNEINREIAKSMIQNEVSIIDMAENGKIAVEMVVQKGGYDVVLMDLNMPVKNGYDAAVEINALQSVLKRSRIIAVSADAFEETSERCAKLGIAQHIAKPFTRDALIEAVLDPTVRAI
jgi:signal transduction histidine kinase/CheY-like chemotaxis protein